MGAGPALRTEGLRRSVRGGFLLRRTEILTGVDLEVPRGEVLGLVGPNGSGKSTLLRILAGVDRATGGSVRVLDGAPASAAVRRRVGYLPEDSPFPPELTLRGALDLLGALQGMDRRRRRERAELMLARVELASDADLRLARCSRGMLRRFGLAQAFLHEPELALLDEPSAGLDATGFIVLERLIAEARAAGATVVLCSHLVADLATHADRVAVLWRGRVAARGRPEELGRREGRVQLELAGADDALLAEVERVVEAAGAEIVARSVGGGVLLALYKQLEHGADGTPGGSWS